MYLFRRTEAPPPPEDDDIVDRAPVPALPPSRLQGREPMYGWVVGLEVLVVSVITAFGRHGVGAPKNYTTIDTLLIIVSIVAALGYLALLRVHNRTLAAFGAIIAAYLPSLVPGPNWVRDISEFGLLPPLVYAIVVAQRMRKATRLAVANDKAAGRPAARARREPTAPRTRSRGRKPAPAPKGPQRNARYTPPKPRRPPVKNAAEAAPSRNQRRPQKSE